MLLEKMSIPVQNQFLTAYKEDDIFTEKYFDYANLEESYKERVSELSTRQFKRDEIADVIQDFMEPFGLSEAAKTHIQELRQEDAVTIVGGQQAGILTGPLYSVHKAITVVLHAQAQRRKLGIPVIPVFWVAGEDHDIDEINHVHTQTEGQVMKEQMYERFVLKLTASDTEFDRHKMVTFVKTIFGKFGETAYTEALLAEVLEAVQQENTFTGFFVRLMNDLFAKEGLLFIDAAYEPLRKLESEYFCQLIKASEYIAHVVNEKEEMMHSEGFNKPIGAEKDAAHLFYIHETGRALLSRSGERFVNEAAGLEFTEEELLEIAQEQPALLSNNVVTRPIMQEYLLPVLAFVGGAGELAYWAILKEAFHHLSLKMPIFLPRMSITFISRQTEKQLKEQDLTVEDVMEGKAAQKKAMLVEKFHDNRFIETVNQLQETFTSEYEKLTDWFEEDNQMMQQLLQQNLKQHERQFDYLRNKYEDTIYVRHGKTLRQFDQLEAELYPLGQLQERIYHPYVYLNEYGPSLIQDLLALPFENDGEHYNVYL